MKNIKRVLAIETSCDDTSVAIVSDRWVESLVTANQDIEHAPFGGIVPELAGRSHTLTLLPLVEKAIQQAQLDWSDIDGIAVTSRPGLIGSLIVGVVTAKSLAMAKNKVVYGVNHLEGHILAPFLKDKTFSAPDDFDFPFLALAVSGGHTTIYNVHALGKYEVMGATLDDAAGEALDKFAKLVGLGFPGGSKIDQLSRKGSPSAYSFPRSMLEEDSLQMSFSGLKSSATRLLQNMTKKQIQDHLPDLCASYQEAVVDILLAKIQLAQKITKQKRVVITGGVSANSRLRERAEFWASEDKLTLVMPPLRYCTDNAAMIGLAGIWHMRLDTIWNDVKPLPHSLETDFI